MKQREKFEHMFRREKHMGALEDLSIINALLIVVMALIFLIDIARYQWILVIIMMLGVLMNVLLVLCGFLRKNWIFCGVASVATLGYLGSLIYVIVL